MIDRYSRKEMKEIWSEENKTQKWLDVELAVIEAFEYFGIITTEIKDDIKTKAKFSVERIKEIEKTTKHDVIAFLTNLEENIGINSRWIHKGMTSSDMLDTAFAIQLKEAGNLILKEVDDFLEILKNKAFEHQNTVMIGRSHGIHAEPTTFGLTLASFYEELKRDRERLINGIKVISVGQISGAVGTFAFSDPKIEKKTCEFLNLEVAPISTQVISRDRHMEFFWSLLAIATTLDKMAINLRHLQRTEVLEVEEYFSKGQKGSSAMPHKRNPISGENISGITRLIKSNFFAAVENVALWHERDISHSSVERIIAPDTTTLTHYALSRYKNVIKNLVVYPQNMKNNLNKLNGLIFSQALLLKLTDKEIERQTAYTLVQRNAMKSFKNNSSFKNELFADKELMTFLSEEEINQLFDVKYHLKHVDTIFKRVFL